MKIKNATNRREPVCCNINYRDLHRIYQFFKGNSHSYKEQFTPTSGTVKMCYPLAATEVTGVGKQWQKFRLITKFSFQCTFPVLHFVHHNYVNKDWMQLSLNVIEKWYYSTEKNSNIHLHRYPKSLSTILGIQQNSVGHFCNSLFSCLI